MEQQARRLIRTTLQLYRGLDPIAVENATRLKTTCKEGCAHCCRYLVFSNLGEALVIAEHIRTSAEWAGKIEKLKSALNMQVRTLALPSLTSLSYAKKQIPCVFLTADNRCGIYPVRPTECRYYYVANEPSNCSASTTSTGPLHIIEHKRIVHAAFGSIMYTKQRTNLPIMVMPLQIVLLWAFVLLEEGQDAFALAFASASGIMGQSYWLRRDTPLKIELAERKDKPVMILQSEKKEAP